MTDCLTVCPLPDMHAGFNDLVAFSTQSDDCGNKKMPAELSAMSPDKKDTYAKSVRPQNRLSRQTRTTRGVGPFSYRAVHFSSRF